MPPFTKPPVRIIRSVKSGCGKSASPQGSSHFPSPGRTNLRTAVLVRKLPAQEPEPEHIRDARTLTATALRIKYRTTYDSWKNMKSRRKTQGAIIAPEFEAFPNFLAIQGPRPTPAYTLDRLDNGNRTYGPGLCQWRDKIAQANNRRSTIYLNHDGKCLALSEWARRTEQRADTMRKRKAAGWSDSEIVTGKRTAPTQHASFRWPSSSPEIRQAWERRWLKSRIRDPLDFILRETKQRRDELEVFLCENINDDGTTDFPEKEQEFLAIDQWYQHYRKIWLLRERKAETDRLYKMKSTLHPFADWFVTSAEDDDDSEDE